MTDEIIRVHCEDSKRFKECIRMTVAKNCQIMLKVLLYIRMAMDLRERPIKARMVVKVDRKWRYIRLDQLEETLFNLARHPLPI